MAKIPKKDMNLYPLVVAPKKNTVKKGALFAVAGAAAVVLLVGGYVGARVYVHTQENLVAEMQEKANDAELMEKINNANAVAADINTLRTAGNAYSEIRVKIDGSQEYCDNFSDDLVEKLVSCEDTVSPSKGATKVAKITGLSYDGSVFSIDAYSTDSQYVSTFVANLTRLERKEQRGDQKTVSAERCRAHRPLSDICHARVRRDCKRTFYRTDHAVLH